MGADFWLHCPKCGKEGEPNGLAVEENIHFECGTTATSPLELNVHLDLSCRSCGFKVAVRHREYLGDRQQFRYPDEAEEDEDEDEDGFDDEERLSNHLAALDLSEGISRR